jgi:hypothetical protein
MGGIQPHPVFIIFTNIGGADTWMMILMMMVGLLIVMMMIRSIRMVILVLSLVMPWNVPPELLWMMMMMIQKMILPYREIVIEMIEVVLYGWYDKSKWISYLVM